MKILFIGDYSNLHTTLAHELRKIGHQVHLISDGCGHMNLKTDIFLKRMPGIWGGVRYLYNLFELLPSLKNYDVVQLINSNFLSLKPQRIKYFFDRIKEQNKSVFLTLAGNDYFYCKACLEAKLFRFSEFKIGQDFSEAHKKNPEVLYGWLSNANKIWAKYLLENINGAMAVLPEYHMPVKDILGEKLTFTNLPIDFSEIPQETISFKDEKVNILVGMRSGFEDMKGVKNLYKIAKEIQTEISDKVSLRVAKDLPFREFLDKVSNSDIILDQLYSYSPAMTALYGMALGKVVCTGAQPEYYEYIGNPETRPLITLSPTDTDIKERIIKLINNREDIQQKGRDSKTLALLNNNSTIVVQRFLNHWVSHS